MQVHIIIQFNGYLLTCRIKSISAYYKARAKTQTKHNIHKKTLNRQNKNNIAGKKLYKRITEAEPLYPETTQITLFKYFTD